VNNDESINIRSQINYAKNTVDHLNTQKDSLINLKNNMQNEISSNLDSKLQNYMEAIANMCSRIENNVSGVKDQMHNLEQRLGDYETQMKDNLNESKIISTLNQSKHNYNLQSKNNQ